MLYLQKDFYLDETNPLQYEDVSKVIISKTMLLLFMLFIVPRYLQHQTIGHNVKNCRSNNRVFSIRKRYCLLLHRSQNIMMKQIV